MAKQTTDIEMVRELALALPEVVESSMHGAAAFKLRGKLLACPALHRSAEPDSLAVRLDFEQSARLIEAAPQRYYVTEHYVSYPIVLARLPQMNRAALQELLELAWQCVSAETKTSARKGRKQE